jgi:hypothetical protein
MMNPDLATEYVGGQLVLQDLIEKKLLKPRVQRRRCTRYDRVELDNALDHWRGFEDGA